MLLKLVTSGFKSIGTVPIDIQFGNLTLLAGQNGSGKSSILESVLLLRQVIGSGFSHTCNLYGAADRGPYYHYTSPFHTYMAHRGDEQYNFSSEFHFELTPDGQKQIESETRGLGDLGPFFDFLRQNSTSVVPGKAKPSLGYKYVFSFQHGRGVIQSLLINGLPVLDVRGNQFNQETFPALQALSRAVDAQGLERRDIFGITFNNGSDELWFEKGFSPQAQEPKGARFSELLSKFFGAHLKTLRGRMERLYLLRSIRGAIPFQKNITASPLPNEVGGYGENLIELLTTISGQVKHRQIAKRVNEWAQRFGIGPVSAGVESPGKLSGSFQDEVFNVPLNLLMLSDGLKRVLTTIVQLIYAPPNSTIAIEEPEAAMNPSTLVLFAELLCEVIAEGKQIILTTHSPLVILLLPKMVEAGLKSDAITIYETTRSPKGTEAKRLEMTEDGYLASPIQSFLNAEADLFARWTRHLPAEEDAHR